MCSQNVVKEHDCRHNHDRSVKSMEAAMAINMVLKNDLLIKSNCRIKCLIRNDDSSAIAALRKLVTYSIIKQSDFSHVKKTFNSKLYDIKLVANLREYFSKFFALSIKKNKGDATKVKIALENIVPHAWDSHSNCEP